MMVIDDSGTHLISLPRVDTGTSLFTSTSIESSIRPGKQRQRSFGAVGGHMGDNYHGQIVATGSGSVVGGRNHNITIMNSPSNGEPCPCTYHFDVEE
jgi:hypothetical protein